MERETRPALDRFSYQTKEEMFDLTNNALGKKYVIFDLIRKNENCYIYYGIDKDTKEERTFKFYNLREIEAKKSFRQKQVCKRVSNYEYEVLHKCKSINILKCFDIYEDQSYKVLVYEYCNMGSLKDQIEKRSFKAIDEIRAIIILKQIISALKSLHENCQVLHKNLKSNKIMVNNGVYKIIDFGFPKVMGAQNQDKNGNFIVPQLIGENQYDSKAQVWSVGMLFHQILLGKVPSSCRSKAQLMKSVKNTPSALDYSVLQQLHYSSEVIHFLFKCLMFEPAARMSWNQLEKHPILKKVQVNQEQPMIPKRNPIFVDRYSSTLLAIQNEQQGRSQVDDDPFYSQKFNFEKDKRDILKEIQKGYHRLGFPFTIEKLDNASIYSLKNQVQKEEEVLYIQAKQYYQKCLRVQFVLQEIIKPMISVLRQRKRQDIEFIYLLVCRCFAQISKMNSQMKGKSEYCSILMKCVKKLTKQVYSDINQFMKIYGLKLTQSQSYWKNILSDKITSWMNSSSSKERDRFFVGIQTIDYQKQEQISFTLKRYEQIQRKITSSARYDENKDQNYSKSIGKLKIYMSVYRQIWNSSSDQIEEYPTIKCFIDHVLLKNNG